MKIVLASASPRRRELMNIICSDFEVRPGSADETLPDGIPAEKAAEYLAKIKAEASSLNKDEIVIGCDTVVILGETILGKPHDKEDCKKMLRMLSGKTHKVCTGVCIRTESLLRTFSVMTNVSFFELDDQLIDRYINTGEPFDKAGGYGIQGKGSLLISEIAGDYFNVVGLPVSRLYRELNDILL